MVGSKGGAFEMDNSLTSEQEQFLLWLRDHPDTPEDLLFLDPPGGNPGLVGYLLVSALVLCNSGAMYYQGRSVDTYSISEKGLAALQDAQERHDKAVRDIHNQKADRKLQRLALLLTGVGILVTVFHSQLNTLLCWVGHLFP